MRRFAVEKLLESEVREGFQSVLLRNLTLSFEHDINQHWTKLQQALSVSALTTCGVSKKLGKHWITGTSLNLLRSQETIPAGMAHNDQRRDLRRQLKSSIRNDREKWWVDRASEMEAANSCGNTHKLFQLLRATGKKKPCVSETICEIDGSPITGIHRRMERWKEHFSMQFSKPEPVSTTLSAHPSIPWLATPAPPLEAEIR